jgi:hypothetical protein
MPKQKRADGAGRKAAAGSSIAGRMLGVPTDFFGIEIEGARYLGKVNGPDASRPGMVCWKIVDQDTVYWAPVALVTKWLITDEEAAASDAEWYEDRESSDASETEQPAAPVGCGKAPKQRATNSAEPKGKVENGRWRPAEATKTSHPVDNATWKRATAAAAASYKPVVHARSFPSGSDAKEGFQAPVDEKTSLWDLFSLQWDSAVWKLAHRLSNKRVTDLKLNTLDAFSHQPKPKKAKKAVRRVPKLSISFIIRLHVIIAAMGLVKLSARKYYWQWGICVGNTGVRIKDIMSQKAFEQGMRALCVYDPSKRVERGDRTKPPPEGYDRLFKTRELDTLLKQNTLAAHCPGRRLANDECSEDHSSGKNGEGMMRTFNKDKPLKWASRVQAFNELDGSRVVWEMLSLPKREKAEYGETYSSTMQLARMVHARYGKGFCLSEDSAYHGPILAHDLSRELKWNALGTCTWNRRGLPQGSEYSPAPEGTTAGRGDYQSWITSVSGVPMTYTLMQDNATVRFLTSEDALPNPGANGKPKPRWNKVTREYDEVYIPPVKTNYDSGKVGCDLFDQYIIATSYKCLRPWMAHYVWLYLGCIVNTHLYRSKLVKQGLLSADAKARNLVDDTSLLLGEMLDHADTLEKRGDQSKDPKARVRQSRVGSPTKHLPGRFKKRGRCLVCRKIVSTGCLHPNCGHLCLHDGSRRSCWKMHHSNGAEAQQLRARGGIKKKRVHAEPASPKITGKRLSFGTRTRDASGCFRSEDC